MDSVKKVQELMKLPQHLCNMCGKCCNVAIFKGGLSYHQILELINNPETPASQIEGAKDFLTIFHPFDSHKEVENVAPEFFKSIMSKTKNENITFFRCKFVGKNGGCEIHEDRPGLCRVYPFPHEKTHFFPGCGFEKQSNENLKKIHDILKEIEERKEGLEIKINVQKELKNMKVSDE